MTSNHETTQAIVLGVIAKYKKMRSSDINVEALLSEDLSIDSLGRLEIAFELQNVFGHEIPDEDLPKIKTVADIIVYIDEIKGKQS